jgi:hypothetical protein
MLNGNVQIGITQCRHHTFDVRLGNECARWTTSGALTAVDATGYVHSFVKGGTDDRFGTAVDKINARNALDFIANTDAFSAFDALFGISDNRLAGRVHRIGAALSDKSPAADSERFGKFPELAGAVAFAEEAIVGMVGEEQFDDHSSGIDDSVGLGFDLHSGGYGKRTTRHETSLSFDFDDADSAGTGGGETFVIAKGGDFDSHSAESGKEHFSLGGIDLAAIDFNLNGIGHSETETGKMIYEWSIVRYFGGNCNRMEKRNVVQLYRIHGRVGSRQFCGKSAAKTPGKNRR